MQQMKPLGGSSAICKELQMDFEAISTVPGGFETHFKGLQLNEDIFKKEFKFKKKLCLKIYLKM